MCCCCCCCGSKYKCTFGKFWENTPVPGRFAFFAFWCLLIGAIICIFMAINTADDQGACTRIRSTYGCFAALSNCTMMFNKTKPCMCPKYRFINNSSSLTLYHTCHTKPRTRLHESMLSLSIVLSLFWSFTCCGFICCGNLGNCCVKIKNNDLDNNKREDIRRRVRADINDDDDDDEKHNDIGNDDDYEIIGEGGNIIDDDDDDDDGYFIKMKELPEQLPPPPMHDYNLEVPEGFILDGGGLVRAEDDDDK